MERLSSLFSASAMKASGVDASLVVPLPDGGTGALAVQPARVIRQMNESKLTVLVLSLICRETSEAFAFLLFREESSTGNPYGELDRRGANGAPLVGMPSAIIGLFR
jgi:hypothetical protein